MKMTKTTKKNLTIGCIFLLPNIIGFACFTLYPILASLVYSFTKWDGFGEKEFIGIKNYIDLFSDETFIISLKNTIFFAVTNVPITLALAILVAVILNQDLKFIKVFRTGFFMPFITSALAIAVVWQLLYHPTMGPINGFLMSLGIKNPPKWLSSTKWAMPSVIIMYVWKMVGYYMVIFVAGLQKIPKALYEAADIDGASVFGKFKNITLPMLSPVIFFASIIGIINSFKVFTEVYALTSGGPGRSTNVLVYSIYIEAFEKHHLGYASAMAYILFLIVIIVTLIQFRGQKNWVNY